MQQKSTLQFYFLNTYQLNKVGFAIILYMYNHAFWKAEYLL